MSSTSIASRTAGLRWNEESGTSWTHQAMSLPDLTERFSAVDARHIAEIPLTVQMSIRSIRLEISFSWSPNRVLCRTDYNSSARFNGARDRCSARTSAYGDGSQQESRLRRSSGGRCVVPARVRTLFRTGVERGDASRSSERIHSCSVPVVLARSKHSAQKISLRTYSAQCAGSGICPDTFSRARAPGKILRRLPCRGPVDLWMNHQFQALSVRATRRPIIAQRLDGESTNSYSILPVLNRIGVIDGERASLYQVRQLNAPCSRSGPGDSGMSSLAMALSMLGYRCCKESDLQRASRVRISETSLRRCRSHLWTHM